MANVAVTCIKNGRSDSFGRPLVSGTYYPSVEIETAKALWNSGYVSVADASVFDQDPLAGTSPIDDFNVARALSLSRQPAQTSANLAAELVVAGAANSEESIWQPPVQPHFLAGGPIDAGTATAEQAITSLWEPLRAANSSYITRELIGKDQSGAYDIWRYVLTPPNYTKTIVLTGATHGLEVTGMICLYLLVKALCDGTDNHANLRFLRTKCRIVIIPIVNPWGMNQSPTRERRNSRLIDPNRNADYRWGNYTETLYYEKGTAPWSEKESQYVRDTILAYPDATAFVDCHNTTSSGSYHLYGFVPSHEGAPMSAVRRVIDGIQTAGMTQQIATLPDPLMINWASATQGLNSMVIEWNDGKDGNAMYSSADITLALRWFANLIMAFAALPKAGTRSKVQPRAWEMQWRTGVDVLAFQYTTYTELLPLQMTLDINSAGMLYVSGEMTVAHSTTADNVFVCPKIGQSNTGFFSTAVNSVFESYARLQDASDRITIPFNACIPVFQPGDFTPQPVVGMYCKTTSGAAAVVVQRYRMVAIFIPSDASARVEHYDATGRLSTGVGALLRTFPTVAT